MRDLDSRGVITGDFLLVLGDLMSNVDILPALQKHRRRREKDKNAIMTMILHTSQGQRKGSNIRPIFVFDCAKDQCIQYEELRPGQKANIEPQHLGNQRLAMMEDLEDPQIDICTPDLLSLWSDNFDYTSLRTSFLRRVLKDTEETSHGKTIHTYIAQSSYAKRVRDLEAYHMVSRDVMARKTYPLCPDANLLLDQDFSFEKHDIYRESNVTIDDTGIVKNRSVIGRESTIGEGATISNSTVGKKCQIGANAYIVDSYLWDDVWIGEGSHIVRAVVANSARVGKSCTVKPGALISYGAVVEDNKTVSGLRKLTEAASSNASSVDRSHNSSELNADQYIADSDEGDSVPVPAFGYRQPSASGSTSSFSVFGEEEDSDIEEASIPSRTNSISSFGSEKPSSVKRAFVEDTTAGILDMMINDYTAEDLGMELNRDRMQANADPSEVRRAVATALMDRISTLIQTSCTASSGQIVMQVVTKYGAILKPWLSDGTTEQRTDQTDFINWLQKASLGKPKGDNLLLFALKELYELEVLDENGILQWWEKDEKIRQASAAVEPFITFLKEAEEEESEDGDESSEEEG